MKFLALFLLMLLSGCATAGLDATVGAGIGKDVLSHQPFERYGTLGVRYGDVWKTQANAGYWLAFNEQNSSLYTSLQGGLEVVGQGGTFAQFMFGPAYIGQDDSKLTGHFQFHMTGGVGVKNVDNYGISFLWTHFSNAGIEQPNLGRDLLTLQLIIPLHSPPK